MTMTDFGCYLMLAGCGLVFVGIIVALAGIR